MKYFVFFSAFALCLADALAIRFYGQYMNPIESLVAVALILAATAVMLVSATEIRLEK